MWQVEHFLDQNENSDITYFKQSLLLSLSFIAWLTETRNPKLKDKRTAELFFNSNAIWIVS